jgi:pilus assembly protein CpaB
VNQSKAFLTSLLFAGAGMLLVFFYVSEQESKIKATYGTEVSVVIAAKDINEMDLITEDMLSTKVVPAAFAQPGAKADKNIFVGTVASAPLRKSEQILMSKVLIKGANTGLASQVAISHRGISIPVTDVTGVTRLLKPGDRVDIIANIPYGGDSEVKTVLQNVHVLAVGEMIQSQIPEAFEEDPVTGNKRALNLKGNRNFTTITVEVTPLDAQNIVYIMQVAGTDLYAALRNPIDRVIASIPTTTVNEVLGSNSKKAERERNAIKPLAAPIVAPPRPLSPWKSGGGVLVQ